MRHIFRLLIAAVSFGVIGGTASAQQTVRVVADGASIWSAPSVPTTVLTTVRAGTILEVVGRVESWYKVRLPNDTSREGYILVRQVQPATGQSGIPPAPSRTSPARTAARRGPPRRAFLSVGAGYHPQKLDFDNEATFTESVEQGSRTTTYSTKPKPLFDLAYGVEVAHGVFVAGAVSRFSGGTDAEIDEQVPHPFFFNQMRTLKGTATDLPREEINLHFQAAVLLPINRRFHLMLAAGPSSFRLKQTFVTDVTYTEEFPFDTVTFKSASTAVQEKTAVGANAQVDFVAMVAKHMGVDASARFSHASLKFKGSDASTFTVAAGKWQVGVGLRAEF